MILSSSKWSERWACAQSALPHLFLFGKKKPSSNHGVHDGSSVGVSETREVQHISDFGLLFAHLDGDVVLGLEHDLGLALLTLLRGSAVSLRLGLCFCHFGEDRVQGLGVKQTGRTGHTDDEGITDKADGAVGVLQLLCNIRKKKRVARGEYDS